VYLTVFATLAMAMVPACSDGPSRPPGLVGGGEGGGSGPISGGRSGGDGGVVDGGGDASTPLPSNGALCSELGLASRVIEGLLVAQDPPVWRGGVLPDGTFDLREFTVFGGAAVQGGPVNVAARAVIRIQGSTWQERYEFSGPNAPASRRASGRIAASGNQLSVIEDCPRQGFERSWQYSYVEPTLVIYDAESKQAFTFAKQ